LHGHGLKLESLDAAHLSHFAFDWATGLLYFTEQTNISVVDLKQAKSEELLIYPTNSTQLKTHEITGLVVRPDNVSLVWMEFHRLNDNKIVFMQSSQV